MAHTASSSASFADPSSDSDSPILSLLNKRLRALRKKLNRIRQMEEDSRTLTSLNNDQLELLRSKPSILARIDELEKLRHPLSLALHMELELAYDKFHRTRETLAKQQENEDNQNQNALDLGAAVSDLLALLYFGRIFDVETLTSGQDSFFARVYERDSCLTHDFVTDEDDVGSPLNDWDLDMIVMLGNLLISRSDDSRLSHRCALQKCLEHARLWMQNADLPIHPGLGVTYAGLRKKLNRILDSEFVTLVPEIRVPFGVTAAVSSYNYFQVPLHESLSSVLLHESLSSAAVGSHNYFQVPLRESLSSAAGSRHYYFQVPLFESLSSAAVSSHNYFQVPLHEPLSSAAVSNHNYFQVPRHEPLSSQVSLDDQGAEYDQDE